MKTEQIKLKLIEKIRKSNDDDFLRNMLDLFPGEGIYNLTLEEENAINIAREEIKNGEYYSHKQVMRDLNKSFKN
ncbi:hypothetical protein ACW6QP_10155 [Salegentibacter sp. HM20]